MLSPEHSCCLILNKSVISYLHTGERGGEGERRSEKERRREKGRERRREKGEMGKRGEREGVKNGAMCN